MCRDQALLLIGSEDRQMGYSAEMIFRYRYR